MIPFGLVSLAAVGMLLTPRCRSTPRLGTVILTGFVFGFGLGNTVAPSTTRMTLATPPARSGSGSAVQNTVRQVAAALGVAVICSVVATKYSGAMSSVLEGSPLPPDLRDAAADSVGATYERRRAAARPPAGEPRAGRRAAGGR